MKPLTLDQQIQISRVLGWVSLMIEGTALPREHHEYIARAAKELCPALNLDDYHGAVDNLWELGGIPEGGLANDRQERELDDSLKGLARPLRRAKVEQS